jgi:hypothetical protein
VAPRLIGYWYSEDAPSWPDPRRFVDEKQDEENRGKVIDFLQGGAVSAVSGGIEQCRLCGHCFRGSMAQSDGYYCWVSPLVHYIEAHSVRLPDEFIQHVLERKPALPPPEFGTSVDADWWRSQPGWHDGGGVRFFPSHRSVYGSLRLIRAARPTTGEQLSFLRRFDTGKLGTRELMERLKDRTPWELAAGLHVAEADPLAAEAETLGLRLEFCPDTPETKRQPFYRSA